jgi:SAM-dependent methyltransferase
MTLIEIRDLLACPVCHGLLSDREVDTLYCGTCDIRYSVRSGIPILSPPEPGLREQESPLSHKAQQIAYSDRQQADSFEITRPRGAPTLYENLLRDKFRRSVIGLEGLMAGSTTLVTCGGAGMDAHFLVEAGARVILSDISPGILMQARERSERFDLGLALVVADAEALPFADASVDIAYVHDGLHHLEHPARALAEMARVARKAVSVTEPARSLATRIAVRAGIALDVEEAGNPVFRLTLEEIVEELRTHGFQPVRPHRYGMFYRHRPGVAVRALSKPGLARASMGALRAVNGPLGRFGNKLTVQAVRTAPATSHRTTAGSH